MTFVPTDEVGDIDDPSPESLEAMNALKTCVQAYLKTAESLLAGKYSSLCAFAPAYLSNPGNVFIALCPDGVVVRYESKRTEKRSIGVAVMAQGIAQTALEISQNLVRVVSDVPATPLPERELGIELRMFIASPTDRTQDLLVSRIWFEAHYSQPAPMSQSPSKPYCLLSVRNELAFEIHGEVLPVDGSSEQGQPFISKAEVSLGAGWQCIEVFPGFDQSAWKAEYAPLWAENDLLGCLLMNQRRQVDEQTLDPRAATRRQYAALLAQFKALLDSDPDREQTLQAFLQSNPKLLCPAHVQMWPKLPLGARVTDFVFRDAANDYLLVELERSTLALFRQDEHATAALTTAQGQIVDWKRYLGDNLQTVQRELGLAGITPNPSGLVVIGRSKQLTPVTRRKLQTMMNESPKLRVMTYDDVYENAKAVLENILGPMWDVGGSTRIFYPNAADRLPRQLS